MRRHWLSLSVVAAIIAVGPAGGRAAHDLGADSLSATGDELIVFEVTNCVYCALFRRDVLPRYQRSTRARSVPIRFVDARTAAARQYKLAEPLQTVPTFVLMRRGREAGRVAGYTGPEPFFHFVRRMIGQAR